VLSSPLGADSNIDFQRSKLIERYQIDPRVVGISGSKKMIFSPEDFDHSNWRAPYDNKANLSVTLIHFTRPHTGRGHRSWTVCERIAATRQLLRKNNCRQHCVRRRTQSLQQLVCVWMPRRNPKQEIRIWTANEIQARIASISQQR